jgi:predicted metal-dependent phosphoesterase TrpH
MSFDVEAIMSMPHGAIFRRADLHIHTPASSDFHADRASVTPADIISAARRKNLDIIAITDHNTADWCAGVAAAALALAGAGWYASRRWRKA